MRAVIVHAPDRNNVPELRQALLGAGLDCLPEDCVVWNDLQVRLAQNGDVDLLVFQAGQGAPENLHAVLNEARMLTPAPVLAVGPRSEEDERRARQAGVAAYLDEANLANDLDNALERFTAGAPTGGQRGSVWSVFAPTPGSGGTTVAANLAGALARNHPQQTTLLEFSRQFGELALFLGAKPEYSTEELCRRYHRVDVMSLRNSVIAHASGVNLLVHSMDALRDDMISPEAVRRLAVLARVAFPYTVMALDSRLGREKWDAMRVSDRVVLVVRADVPSVKRAEWELNAAEDAGLGRGKFHLVVNRWGQRGQLKLSEIERALNLKVQYRLPDDPGRMNNALNHGLLLQQLSRGAGITRRFNRLADDLLKEVNASNRNTSR